MKRRIPLALVVVLLLASPILAQSIRDQPMFHPGIRRAEFEAVVEKLAFESEETELLFRVLYDDFEDAFEAAASRVNRRFDEVHARAQAWRAENPDRSWGDEPDFGWREVYEEWVVERDSIEANLERDVAAMLDSERLKTWKRLTQASRRKRLFEVTGLLHSGHQLKWAIELEEVLDGRGLSTVEINGLDQRLNQWSDEFDQALRTYRDEYDQYVQRVRERGQFDIAAVNDREFELYLEDWNILRRRQLEINRIGRQWVEEIARILGDEQGEMFLDAARRAAYPMLFHPSPVEAIAERLDELSLDATTKANIRRVIDQRYAERQTALRLRMIDAHDAFIHASADRSKIREAVRLRAEGEAWDAPWQEYPGEALWIENRQLSIDVGRQIRSQISEQTFRELSWPDQLLLSWWEEE